MISADDHENTAVKNTVPELKKFCSAIVEQRGSWNILIQAAAACRSYFEKPDV